MTTSYTYPNAIIYGIKCNETGEVYIGSTVRKLERRMDRHRCDATQYKTWVAADGKRPRLCCSIQIIDRGNYCVFQIESYPCNTKTELCLREGIIQMQYKSSMGALCINMCIAGAIARAGGKVEYFKQYNKQYYTDNADTIREQRKQYYTDNADTILEQKKQYYIENADTIREKKKQYRKDNTEKIAARIGVKHNCSVCGGIYTHGNKTHHFKTKVHQRAVQCNEQASAHHDS